VSEAKADVIREKFIAGLGGALLLIALVLVYANHFTTASISTTGTPVVELTLRLRSAAQEMADSEALPHAG
jgi:hypothetical protein